MAAPSADVVVDPNSDRKADPRKTERDSGVGADPGDGDSVKVHSVDARNLRGPRPGGGPSWATGLPAVGTRAFPIAFERPTNRDTGIGMSLPSGWGR